MGPLALCAKITHVPSMDLSELPGPRQGSRQAAIAGHREISRRCRALGVDSLVVFDSHWLVNAQPVSSVTVTREPGGAPGGCQVSRTSRGAPR